MTGVQTCALPIYNKENKNTGKDEENKEREEKEEGIKKDTKGKINNKDNPEPQANIKEE